MTHLMKFLGRLFLWKPPSIIEVPCMCLSCGTKNNSVHRDNCEFLIAYKELKATIVKTRWPSGHLPIHATRPVDSP